MVSMEDNVVMSSEDSSSTDDQGELELGLGLSICGAAGFKGSRPRGCQQYARILTAKDLPSKSLLLCLLQRLHLLFYLQ
ncbi:hypothetical protein OIU78_010354 [Salix suchowensis]|nr:hypothetical protein OIU78_010354 [Salix suchowensis]